MGSTFIYGSSEGFAADHHPRVARLCARAHQGHRAAHGPNRARRERRRRVRRRDPVHAGLRLLSQADGRRLGPRPHHESLGGADEAPPATSPRVATGVPPSPARWRARRRRGLLGIHINLPATVPPEVAAVLAGGGPAPAGFSEKERAALKSLDTFYKKNRAYSVMMGTRPQTIGRALYEAFEVKRYFTAFFTFFIPVSLFDSESHFFAPTHTCWKSARAGGLSNPAVALRSPHAPSFPGRALTAPSTAARWLCGDDASRGTRCRGTRDSYRNLVSGGSQ